MVQPQKIYPHTTTNCLSAIKGHNCGAAPAVLVRFHRIVVVCFSAFVAFDSYVRIVFVLSNVRVITVVRCA